MKRSHEIMAAIGLTTSLALGATACGAGNQAPKPQATIHTDCTGLEFATPKGGPGAIEMNVYPTFNRNFGDARPLTVNGKIVSGNDTGSIVHPNGSGSGEFTFNWDTESTAVQSSQVEVRVDYEGLQLACPDTTVNFNPVNYNVSPHLPNSPY